MLNKKIILAILIMGLFVVSAVNATENVTTEVVGTDNNNQIISIGENEGAFDELSREINAIESNGTLNLTRDYKYEKDSANGIIISKAITIDGQGHTLDGNKNSYIFRVTNTDVVLKNINFINSYTSDRSAVYGTCSIINCSFIDCISEKNGGAFYSNTGPSNIINCSFINNSATYGGAIFSSTPSTCNINNCDFINNVATYGGAIYGDGVITNSKFIGNSATKHGGAIFTKMDSKLSNCNFKDNTAKQDGGAIYSYSNSSCCVNDCIFTNNAATHGAGIYSTSISYEISDCIFTNNSAVDSGGASNCEGLLKNCNFTNNYAQHGACIYSYFGPCNIINCNFINNVANETAGSVYSFNDANLISCNFINNVAFRGGALCGAINLDSCNFINNSAEYGGAFYLKDTSDIINCNFTNNIAGTAGGAIYSYENSTLAINDCRFINNKVNIGDGGAIYTGFGSSCDVNNCEFNDNIANRNGGGIYSLSDYCDVTHSNFINNTAVRGAGIYSYDKAHLDNCSFINNAAYRGAVYLYTGSSEITSCSFIGNTAIDCGGAAYSDILSNWNNCNFINNTAYLNGGAFCGNGRFNDTNFINNVANNDGGAFYSDKNLSDVRQCSFINNVANRHGGALFNIGHVYNCSFVECFADKYAGAIYSGNVYDSSFNKCSANKSGNAIARSVAENCIFIDCGSENAATFESSIKNCTFKESENTTKSVIIECENNINATYNDGKTLVATLKDETGKVISGIKVDVQLNGANSTIISNKNGEVIIPLTGLVPNTYIATITFKGNELYNSANATVRITINKVGTKLTASNFTTTYNSSKNIEVVLNDANNKAINGAQVKIVLGNITKTLTTDSKGQVSLSTDSLVPNNYLANIAFEGNNIYNPSNTTAKVVINKASTALTGNYNSTGKKIVATLKDANGKAISGVKVGFVIDGVKYATTNTNGVAEYSTSDLEEGSYDIQVAFLGNDNYNASNKVKVKFSINKVITILTAPNVTTTYNSGEKLVATLKDANGKVISRAEVKIVLDDVAKTLITDNNGQVSLSTDGLVPNTYTATITFAGDNNYKKSNTTAIVIIKQQHQKEQSKIYLRNALYFVLQTKYVTVTLWDADNNPIANKTVYIRLNDDSWKYSGVTDENGNALIRVGVGFGNHPATISFEGDDDYEAASKVGRVRVIKETPSLMLPGAYTKFKASDSTKTIKVYLKDRYNKPLLKDTKVFVTINGKQYVGLINAEGIASINIILNKAGVYNVDLYYTGNTAYNAVRKTTKITIV